MTSRCCLLALCLTVFATVLKATDQARRFPAQTSESQQVSAIPPCQDGFRWIVNAGSLKRSQPDFPLELQQKYFDSPCTFLVSGENAPADYKDWSAVKTRAIASLAGLDAAVNDPETRAVLYDPEAWEMTPSDEQTDPVNAACRAAAVAHAHHKVLIAAPAVDLIRLLAPGSAGRGQRYAAFEKTEIASQMAKCVDVYEIQAQGAEMDVDQFRQFVAAEAKQARAANPDIIVLAGISTNPNGQRVSAKQVFKAVRSVRNAVAGFWLNIPAGGKYCPSCGQPQPKVAVELLQQLSSK